MSKIEYQTEGKVLIDCEIGNTADCAFSWRKGSAMAMLHSGACTIELSKSQLKQIAEFAGVIAADLAPAGDTK